MEKYIMDEKTGIHYTLVGEIYIPNLVSADTNYEIGMWGQRHAEHLKEHKKSHYTTLLTTSKINSYLHGIDVQAQEMYNSLIKQLAENQGITEQLKADDMMVWVQAMNNISNRAKEILCNEIIYRCWWRAGSSCSLYNRHQLCDVDVLKYNYLILTL